MNKLESGAVSPNVTLHDNGEIVGSALRRASRILSHHDVELELAPDLPMLELDAVLFEQVLFNLLDNAAKYAPSDTMIRIQSWRTAESVCLRVLDEGSGIPAGDLDHIFDKFYRAQKTDQVRAGTGLGLRSRAALSKPCTAPSSRPTAPTGAAPRSPSACRSRVSGRIWMPPHERRPSPRSCGR